ncbi:hypothetical protein [Donghicola mangrovi]|uniref:Uncharacterized protein n=1 Tax=Donghicola mangrovi TaxID=2729614 RepID=A0A850QFK2_9RHOB|nr:hypothetical protein [Donghicola mangrovi]NVO25718.1 hypothetical protein [Donghicola mangrovi]
MNLPALDHEMLKTDATTRAFNTFLKSAGKATVKLTKAEIERQKAFGETMNSFLKELDDEARAGFFIAFEKVASGPNKRRIAGHPQRPNALIDAILSEAGEMPVEAEPQPDSPSVAGGKSVSGKSKATTDASDPFDSETPIS